MEASIEDVLALFGESQVKLRLLERAVEQLRADLVAKDAEIEKLKKDKK
jgi:hypothetical protein